MEQNERIEALLARYWLAETTEEEEEELKNYFAAHGSEQFPAAGSLFSYFEQEKNIATSEMFDARLRTMTNRPRASIKWLGTMWKVAAAVLIIIGAIFLFRQPSQPAAPLTYSNKDTYNDPRQAYMETKKALLLLSRNLNKGTGYIGEIKKINRAEQIIQSNIHER